MRGTKVLLCAVSVLAALGEATHQAVAENQPSTWELIRRSRTSETESAQIQGEERVVHFPRNRSLGMLSLRDASAKWKIETIYRSIYGTDWEYFAEARGDVRVPAGKRLRLTISPAGWRDLSPLSKLGPNDLYMLEFLDTTESAKPDHRCMLHIAHLTGLKVLNLHSANVGDKGLEFVRELRSLEYLGLPEPFSDVGLAYVAELSTLKGLYFLENKVTNAGLRHLGKLTALEELKLGGVYKDEAERYRISVNDAGLVHLAMLPNLSYLHLWGASFDNAGLVHLKNVHSLRVIVLRCLPITDAGLVHSSKCSGLEDLDLYSTKVTDNSLAHLKSMPSLKRLNLRRTQITDDGLTHSRQIRRLEHLQLPGHITDKGLAYVSQLDNLKYLTVGGTSSHITDVGLRHIAKLSMLEELEIGGRDITDEGMSYIAELTKLNKLSVSYAPSVTNTGLAKLTAVKSLRSLSIANTKVTISGLAQLNAMPHLTSLSAAPVPRGGSVLNIGGLSHLESLSVRFGRGDSFTDADLKCLASLGRLETLVLVPCKFSDAGMAHLVGLTQLEYLRIGGSDLTDYGLSYLFKMKKLAHLTIRDGDFTDQGLRHLDGLKSLRRLDITSANAFSNAALRRLRKNLPNLQTLKVMP